MDSYHTQILQNLTPELKSQKQMVKYKTLDENIGKYFNYLWIEKTFVNKAKSINYKVKAQ